MSPKFVSAGLQTSIFCHLLGTSAGYLRTISNLTCLKPNSWFSYTAALYLGKLPCWPFQCQIGHRERFSFLISFIFNFSKTLPLFRRNKTFQKCPLHPNCSAVVFLFLVSIIPPGQVVKSHSLQSQDRNLTQG